MTKYNIFLPGDQAFPTYHQPEVLQVITNAVLWATPTQRPDIQFGKRLLK
jgi:trehalose utilization protein